MTNLKSIIKETPKLGESKERHKKAHSTSSSKILEISKENRVITKPKRVKFRPLVEHKETKLNIQSSPENDIIDLCSDTPVEPHPKPLIRHQDQSYSELACSIVDRFQKEQKQIILDVVKLQQEQRIPFIISISVNGKSIKPLAEPMTTFIMKATTEYPKIYNLLNNILQVQTLLADFSSKNSSSECCKYCTIIVINRKTHQVAKLKLLAKK